MLLYDIPYIILSYFSYSNLYFMLLYVIINYCTVNYYMLFYLEIFELVYNKLLSYCKLNYSTNLKLHPRLFYFKLIYVISSYTLSNSRSFYFMLL